MRSHSKKNIAITAFTIAALVLITLVGVFVAVRTMQKPKHGTKVTISVDDLAEMKTLVHKYLNERENVRLSPIVRRTMQTEPVLPLSILQRCHLSLRSDRKKTWQSY